MVYDGTVSLIRQGAVFSSIGVVLVNLIFTILLPFFGYTILKTAGVAAKKVIFKTVSVCKSAVTSLVKIQVSVCEKIVAGVAKITKVSIAMARLIVKRIIMTMRMAVNIGKTFMRTALNATLKVKDITIQFFKFGLKIVRKGLKLTVQTVRKIGSIFMDIITKIPEKTFKLYKQLMTKIFPGLVKILTLFPYKFYSFIYRWLPAYMRLVYIMCRETLKLSLAVTNIVIYFHMIAAGIQFVGSFFNIGNDFAGNMVKAVDRTVNIIPNIFEDAFDSDSVAPFPDKIINFIIYELNFKTGLNELLNATETTLPDIERKETEIAEVGAELNSYQLEISGLEKEIESSPDEEKELQLSRLKKIADGLEIQLEELKRELFNLELNRKFTFDELILRTLFCNISLFNVYTVPPPIPPMIRLLVNFLFNTNLTPSFTQDIGFSDSWGFDEYASVSITVSASFTIRAITLEDFYPNASEAADSFSAWLDGRLRSEDAYETVDGKKKSKLRAITKNPAAFVKFANRIIVEWFRYFASALGINLERFVSVSASATTDLDTFIPDELEDIISISEPPLGDILNAVVGFTDLTAWAISRAFTVIAQSYGNLLGYFTTEILKYVRDVLFVGLDSTYPSDNFDWL